MGSTSGFAVEGNVSIAAGRRTARKSGLNLTHHAHNRVLGLVANEIDDGFKGHFVVGWDPDGAFVDFTLSEGDDDLGDLFTSRLVCEYVVHLYKEVSDVVAVTEIHEVGDVAAVWHQSQASLDVRHGHKTVAGFSMFSVGM